MKQALRAFLLLSSIAGPVLALGPNDSSVPMSMPYMENQCATLDVVSQNQTLPLMPYKGQTWIEGRNQTEYSLVVTNRCPYRVLAVLSVDGLNVLNGQTASFKQGGYVVEPGQSATVSGWRKSMNDTAAFYFTYPSDSYGSRVGKDRNLGVIGAAFFGDKAQRIEMERRAEERRRMDRSYNGATIGSMADKAEASSERSAGMAAPSSKMMAPAPASPSLGTGHGRSIEDRAVRTSFEREDSPFSVVNYRYETKAKLGWFSLGVYAPQYPTTPQAFPGENFTPDPPSYPRPYGR